MQKCLVKGVMAGVLVSSMLYSGAVFAGQATDNTGCGLGANLIGDKGNDSLVGQLAITFLNSISGNQTFGITSGTSNCQKPARFAKNELNEFVVANMDNLAKDIAMGYGESLDTLAELMDIPAGDRAQFNAQLQSNFSNIYSSHDIESAAVIDNIFTVTGNL